jgi:glyoxylase-like metal-dependent hydrolase (beta-lactamase superfamily II)/rhodanese-related sulfurtransferase
MYFKQFLNDDLGCSAYFIASRQSREAVVVDPAMEVGPYLELAQERGYRITHVIDTHIHADHVSGNRALAAATGAAVCLHESADVLFPFRPLRDAEELRVGQLLLRIVHTPGHRPEAISILVLNPPRSPEPSLVLSGDTLFVGDVGRPDFGGAEGARQQYESVQGLLNLEDYVEVFPAHFEGFCGKGMCGRPSSTIGFERRFNPVLQLPVDEFISLAAALPARPLNMTAIMAANRGAGGFAWPAGWHDEAVSGVPAGQAPAWIAAQAPLVLDVREPREYAAGHLPGAISIPQADLATRLAEIPPDRQLLVACAGGARSLRSAQFLQAVGYGRVTNLEGGTAGWIQAGSPVEVAPAASQPPFEPDARART